MSKQAASQKKKLIIIDGNAIVHRAFHALPPLTTKDGTPAGAVYGFTSIFLKILKEFKPDYLAVTFDMAGPTFRHEAYAAYKATRVKAPDELYAQIPFCHEIARAFGAPIYEKKGYEADDVIGTIAQKYGGHEELETVIFTGDQDAYQLIRPGVSVYSLKKGVSEGVFMTSASIKEKFGLKPGQLIDYKALCGDASDNIPGVIGIGEKIATELLQKFGSVDAVYEAVEKGTDKISASVIKKLVAHKDDALQSRELARIKIDVPIELSLTDMHVRPLERDKVVEILHKFGFTSLLKRLPFADDTGARGAGEEAKAAATGTSLKGRAQQKQAPVIVATPEDVVKIIKNARRIALYPNMSGKPWAGTWRGFAFAAEKEEEKEVLGFVEARENDTKARRALLDALADARATIVGHDLKNLVLWSPAATLWSAKLFDLMIASYLLNPGTRSHDLTTVLFQAPGAAARIGAVAQQGLFGLDKESSGAAAAQMLAAAEKLARELEEKGLWNLFNEIEMPLIPILAQMEAHGIKINPKRLSALSKEIQERLKELTKKIHKHAGQEFNIASPAQLREVLYETLALGGRGTGAIIRKGKTGFSTAASELEKLRGSHPIIPLIEEHRELSKLQSTYVDVLPTLIDPQGRVHTTFNQAVTATGRLSSSDPNLQNIPVRTKLGRLVRGAFVAERGYKLVSADYSQIELRIAASLANDQKMITIFKEGKDIHTQTAAIIHGVPLAKVTKALRFSAKEVNFGVLYGMGVFGLASRTGISQEEARAFIEKYFIEYKGLRRYLQETKKLAASLGYVETMFGRRRYIPEMQSSAAQVRASGERMAVNHPIQGTAADMIKMAMIALEREFLRKNTDIRMLLQVHDELIFEVPEARLREAMPDIRHIMEGVVRLKVPVVVNVAVGDNWGELEEGL